MKIGSSLLEVLRFDDLDFLVSNNQSKPTVHLKLQLIREKFQSIGFIDVSFQGDSYYFAIGIAFLKQLLSIKDLTVRMSCFNMLHDRLFGLILKDNMAVKYLQFLQLLQSMGKMHNINTLEEMSPYFPSDLQEIMIHVLRQVLARYILIRQEELVHGMALKDLITLSLDSNISIAIYCEKYIVRSREEPEKTIVELGILPKCLGYDLTVVYFDRINAEQHQINEVNIDCNHSPKLGHIHLLIQVSGSCTILVPKTKQVHREVPAIPKNPVSNQAFIIRLFFPEKNQYASLDIESCWSPQLILSKVKYAFQVSTHEVAIYRVSVASGWHEELNSENLIDSLRRDDLVTLRKLVDVCVGPPEAMIRAINTESNRGNHIISAKLESMQSQGYTGIRRVKGDGSCYYRAIIIGVIENIFISGDRRRFDLLYNRIRHVFSPHDTRLNQRFTQLFQTIKNATEGNCWNSWEEFEFALLNPIESIDLDLILLCRRLVSQYILSHANETVGNGLTLHDTIKHSHHENFNSLEDYCRNEIERNNAYADGASVDLGILPMCLGCRCSITVIDNRASNQVTSYTQGQLETPALGDVHLLLKNEHYDILYRDAPRYKLKRKIQAESTNAPKSERQSTITNVDKKVVSSNSKLNSVDNMDRVTSNIESAIRQLHLERNAEAKLNKSPAQVTTNRWGDLVAPKLSRGEIDTIENAVSLNQSTLKTSPRKDSRDNPSELHNFQTLSRPSSAVRSISSRSKSPIFSLSSLSNQQTPIQRPLSRQSVASMRSHEKSSDSSRFQTAATHSVFYSPEFFPRSSVEKLSTSNDRERGRCRSTTPTPSTISRSTTTTSYASTMGSVKQLEDTISNALFLYPTIRLDSEKRLLRQCNEVGMSPILSAKAITLGRCCNVNSIWKFIQAEQQQTEYSSSSRSSSRSRPSSSRQSRPTTPVGYSSKMKSPFRV